MKIRDSAVLDAMREDFRGALLCGYRRAHKHVSDPDEESIVDIQLEYLENELHNWLVVNVDL